MVSINAVCAKFCSVSCLLQHLPFLSFLPNFTQNFNNSKSIYACRGDQYFKIFITT